MSEIPDLDRRSSGVLLHPTSLPGPGIGDVGPAAHRFVEWLADAGQHYWQILPLVPVDAGGSPYNGLSALAGNPLLISPELLAEEKLVGSSDIVHPSTSGEGRVDFPAVVEWKDELLKVAHREFVRRPAENSLAAAFEVFQRENDHWLRDYTLFRALRERHEGASWIDWPDDVRRREARALEAARDSLRQETGRYAFQQFLFDRQWKDLRRHAHERGVRIIGDLPIFVAHDSADVWANPEIFQLDSSGKPLVVAGVPPDYFSETGQRWGNPLYRWDVLRARGYDWWVERFRRTLEMVDVVRVDHFRGFEAYWEIPSHAETAVEGRWVKGPGAEFFRRVEDQLGRLPIIAEDLGLITPEVDELRDELGFPGMRVLQFAFDGDARNPHLPGNYAPKSIAYTGTHDNDTITGWWSAAGQSEKGQARVSLGENDPEAWDFIEAVFSSDADLAIVPLQDLLSLSSDARMNTPGRATDNWTWRLGRDLPDRDIAARLRELTRRTGRMGPQLGREGI